MRRNRGVGAAVVLALLATVVAVAAPPPRPARAAADQSDYWLVGADGAVFPFGTAAGYGGAGGQKLARPVAGSARTPDGRGYWLVASDGGIFSFGDAAFHGSTGNLRLAEPVVGMAATVTGGGYWLVASDGGIFAFGDARFFGSTGSLRLNRPIVGMAATPSGAGYWLVASDGGIFAFGDARFFGSTGSLRLNRPIVGMASTIGGDGYWMVAGDGGIFAFGTAGFSGSTAGRRLGGPIVVLLPAPPGRAALLDDLAVAAEGARAGYDRDLFHHWIDADHDGCDTRAEVLEAESLAPVTVGPGCHVTAGDWISPYDGVESHDPATLDIDHMVPLAEAWDSGASAWDASRREAYANDLGYPNSLVAVTATANRSKGDQDPAEWKPPAPSFWCDYATWWTTVKIRWGLTADRAEVDALRAMLSGCDGDGGSPTTTTAPPTPAGIGFGRMQCDAPGTPDDAHNINDEWVELVNSTAAAADLGRWTVADDAANTYTVPAGFTLGAQATVRLHSGGGTDTGSDLYWGRSQHVWNNDGDTAHLRDAGGTPVATRGC
ncbi:MAG TPA: lamin tail domain-containing protein [Acidimicrobiia bacterium]|nr:lamin tail domain-containing protein [Acidimicrobiia bacterium]